MSQSRDPSDIEDVLAAIRRLVREDPAPAASAVSPESPGKLMLTPALRVPEAEPADDDDDADATEEPARHGSAATDVLFLHRPVWTPDGSPPREDAQDSGRDGSDGLEAEIAELEALVSMEAAAESHPDGSEGHGTGPVATPDRSARSVPDAVPPASDPDARAAASAGGATMGARLDEAALREIVSEVVRAELRGAAGERITRTLRHLVRREIQRALAERDTR